MNIHQCDKKPAKVTDTIFGKHLFLAHVRSAHMDGAGFITQIQPPRFDQHLPASLLGTLSCHPSLYTAISQNIKKDWRVKWIKLIILLQWDVLWGENRWCWHSRGSRLIVTAFSKHCCRPSRPPHSKGTPIYWPLQQDLPPHYSGMVWGSWQTASTWPPDSPRSQSDPQESHAKAMVPDPTGHPWGPVSDLSRVRHMTAGGVLLVSGHCDTLGSCPSLLQCPNEAGRCHQGLPLPWGGLLTNQQ